MNAFPEWLQNADTSLFLFLNGLHSGFLDPLFYFGTQSVCWTPFYLLLLYLVIKKYRWKTAWILIAVALMILVSDQAANLFKVWIARPRPTFTPGLATVHIVNNYKGGTFGFYSSHASNNVALAIFLIMILKDTFRVLPALIIFYAFFMSYSRIYLGVHFPLDIFAGWIAGGIIGFATGTVFNYFFSGKFTVKRDDSKHE